MSILPPAMLGILGGGQLGMYFTLAAKRMGYQVTVLDPDLKSPAGHFADRHICAAFEDEKALKQLATTCQAITTEFENIPTSALQQLAKTLPVFPSSSCVAIAQDRIAEKQFLQKIGLLTAPAAFLKDQNALKEDFSFYLPGILKTARLGYDGKGQVTVTTDNELHDAFQHLQYQPCVLEKKLSLTHEISLIAVRNQQGEIATFAPAENHHVNGILATSTIPARLPQPLLEKARQASIHILQELNYIGVLGVEFFIVEDQLLVNEIAPRPHNSGHFTLDATVTSQFEQQVRALCNLSLGNTTLLSPCVMVNILGDEWRHGEPLWSTLLNQPNTQLHLYGKQEARPRRKMGHYTVLNPSIDNAIEIAHQIKDSLCLQG